MVQFQGNHMNKISFLMMVVSLYSIQLSFCGPYCWTNSKRLAEEYDSKQYYPVGTCHCPCKTVGGAKDRCIKCRHIHVTPTNVSSVVASDKVSERYLKPIVGNFIDQYRGK